MRRYYPPLGLGELNDEGEAAVRSSRKSAGELRGTVDRNVIPLSPSEGEVWTKAIQCTGRIHAHCLRKYFEIQVDAAGVNRVYREAMMGHRPQGTDEQYSRPTDEALKTNYVIALEKLVPDRLGPSTEDAEHELALRFLEARVGIDGKEQSVKWAAERNMKRGEAVMRALAYAFDRQAPWNNNSAAESKPEAKPKNGSVKIVEGDDALVRAVGEGWELLKELSGGRYLVRAAASGV